MGNSIIKHVTINKLWGVKTISVDFDKHVNIFIGLNGSSKTTFLRLIEASLLVDLKVFYTIDFESISINFEEGKIQTLIVNKSELNGELHINYIFNNDEEISILCNEMTIQRPYRIPIRYRENQMMVKNRISECVNISWLSVNRTNMDYNEYDRRDIEKIADTVDYKLQELETNLTLYQLQLESDSNKVADKFKEDAISLMLYDISKDSYGSDAVERFASVDTKAMQTDLFKAFRALGVAADKREAIQNHIQKIRDVINKVKEKQDLTLDDIFVLALIKRTLSIIDIANIHDQKKKEIFAPIEKLLNCLKIFMPEKIFLLNNNSGKLEFVFKNDTEKEKPINLSSLSSGEKQLFILLTESLLQKNIPHIFIADEPELSLHIGWQRIIIGKILEMNPNAQIIVATHSPEIAGNYPSNVINMKKITYYE